MVSRDSKDDNFAYSLFLLIIIRSGLLAGIRWSACMSKSHRNLCVIFLDRCWVVHIPFVGVVKFKFSFRVFHTIVTASHLQSPGLFSVFQPISAMLLFRWSPLILLFASPPVLFTTPLVTVSRAPITIGITVTYVFDSFFQFYNKVQVLSFLSISFNFTLWLASTAKYTIRQILLLLLIIIGLVVWSGLGDPFVS